MSPQETAKLQGHEPVLVDETIGWLRPERGGTYVDCTLGLGGHAYRILQASPETRVIGIDRDLQALELARKRLAIFEKRFQALHANFNRVAEVVGDLGVAKVQGVIADLGVSSLQLDRAERGFSFTIDAPLDMRMDQSGGRTAAELIENLSERELADLIFEYGEERGARRVARALARERDRQPILTTRQLAEVVVRALNIPGRWRVHPATRTFQALRIAVNDELRSVEELIPAAVSALATGGRLAIISFHSLEDRIVKRGFQRESGRCQCESDFKRGRPGVARPSLRSAVASRGGDGGSEEYTEGEERDDVICNHCGARKRVNVLTRKPVRPGQREVDRNPRSRSALLRVCERL